MLKRNKILLLCSLVLIISLMVSVSALAFEVSFDGSKGEDHVIPSETVSTMIGSAYATNEYWATVATDSYWAPTATNSYWSPIMTDTVPPPTALPTRTEMPAETAVGTNVYPEYTKPSIGEDGFQTGVENGKDDYIPEEPDQIRLEGSDNVWSGMSFGFSVYVNEPMMVKSGGIELNFDPEIFTLEYANWCLAEAPVILHTDIEQKRGVFAYEYPTMIHGEVFHFSLTVNHDVPFHETVIAADLILNNEDQKEIDIQDPELFVYVGCDAHSFDRIVSDETLAREATCNSYAEYYVSCATCGYRTGEIFLYEEGGFAPHSVGDVWHFDEETHWHGCDNCNELDSDRSKHTFGKWLIVEQATPDKEGIREHSCTVCGYTVSETVKYKPATTKVDADKTEAPETTAAPTEATTTEPRSTVINIGCGSSITLGAIAVLPMLAVGALLFRRKED